MVSDDKIFVYWLFAVELHTRLIGPDTGRTEIAKYKSFFGFDPTHSGIELPLSKHSLTIHYDSIKSNALNAMTSECMSNTEGHLFP
jgi:hypothetical protein